MSIFLALPSLPTFNLEQTLQSVEQIKNTTSQTLQTAISSSLNNWFEQHPILSRLVQLLDAATHHPIISVVLLLFAVSILSSFVKAISKFIETVCLSLLQLPWKGIQLLVKIVLQSFSQIKWSDVKPITSTQKGQKMSSLLLDMSRPILKDKQQRLTDIAFRIEEIQKEQNKLLQEVAEILGISDQ